MALTRSSGPDRDIRGAACTAARSSPRRCAPRRTLSTPELLVHSLRAYFIRRGDHAEPVRYEVDRIRNGRSFATRRVVARQAIGAILNLEASFQRPERSAASQPVAMPAVPGPDELEETSWSAQLRPPLRARVGRRPARPRPGPGGRWPGCASTDDARRVDDRQLLHRCWLAYLSDDLPTDAVDPRPPAPGRARGRRASASAPASTTRSGSTARCAPTSGTSTT